MHAGKIPSPRVQILEKIDELHIKHCEECQFRSKGRAGGNFCIPDVCLVAKKVKTLGEMLIGTKSRIVKKPKISNIKIVKKEVVVLNEKGLTKEIYLKSKDEEMSDKKIMDKYVVDNSSFYKMKNEWGLVNGIAKKREIKSQSGEEKVFKPQINPNVLAGLAEEKIKSLEEIILERDNYIKKLHNLRSEDVAVIDKLKLELETVTNERNDYKNKYTETFNNLQAMQGELNRIDKLRDKDSENTNDSLITEIKSLNKYKILYFKTAETLKLHLPN